MPAHLETPLHPIAAPPLVPAADRREDPSPDHPYAFDPDTPAALIVEDDPLIRECVCGWLSELGWHVHAVDSAEHALQALRSHCFRLALCDVKLSGPHDGVWFANQLMMHSPATDVVFATGIGDLPSATTLRSNIVGYLVKPYRQRDVRQVLDSLDVRARIGRPQLSWPAATRAQIDERRRELLDDIRTAVASSAHDLFALAERLLASPPGRALRDRYALSDAVSRSLGLDDQLMPHVARAVLLAGLGRRVVPPPETVTTLSIADARDLFRVSYPLESRLALTALGLPIAGALVGQTIERSEVPPSKAPFGEAVAAVRGLIAYHDHLDEILGRGADRHQAVRDALMRLETRPDGVDAAVIAAIRLAVLPDVGEED